MLANRDLLDRQEAAEAENDRLAVDYSRYGMLRHIGRNISQLLAIYVGVSRQALTFCYLGLSLLLLV